MKKISLLTAIFCLLLSAGAVFAQQPNAAVNFAGSWELDIAKSKLPERMRVESMTLNVAQTDKQITVETSAKRAPRPEGATPPSDGNGGGAMRQGGGNGGGIGRGGVMGNGNGTLTYNLDGKETTVESSETSLGMPSATVKLIAKMEKDGKLKLVSNRNLETPNGSVNVKTTETWELTDGGKTLKVKRDTETPRGSQTAEMYFTRKPVSAVLTVTAPVAPAQTTIVSDGDGQIPNDAPTTAANQTPKVIKSGVLNGKVLKLVQPEYPPAARAVRATGAVQVQVTFDEQGNVISANAVSGHPLLRAAAEKAARQAKFAPVMLDGVPVKITGIIVYNFVP